MQAQKQRTEDELEKRLDSKIKEALDAAKAELTQYLQDQLKARDEHFGNEIKSLKDAIKTRDGTIKTQGATIQTRDNKIVAAEAELDTEKQTRQSNEDDSFKTRLRAMRAEIALLEQSSTNLADEIAGLVDEVAGLKRTFGVEIADLKENNANLEIRLRDLELPLLFRQVILDIGQHVFEQVCADCPDAKARAEAAAEAVGRNTFCTLSDLVDAGGFDDYVHTYLSDEEVGLLRECKKKGNENAHRHPSLDEARDFLASNTTTCDRAEMLFQYYLAYDTKRRAK